MSSNVTPIMPPPAPASATRPAPRSWWTAIRARFHEPSTWAGLGGIVLVVLNLLPAALPQFHAALTQHGWARLTGLVIALLTFVVAVAKREGDTTIAGIAQAAAVVVEAERARAPMSAV